MAWALQFVSSNLLDLPVSTPYVPLVGHFEITFRIFKASGSGATKLCDSNSSTGRIDININNAGNIDSRSYCHFEVDGVAATSIPYDVWFDLKVIRDGSDADQGNKRLGKIGARYNNANTSTWDLQLIDVEVAGVPTAYFDATASDHSNAGQQPVLVDTVGVYDATGINFPTDGSAWVDLGGGGNVDGTISITMSSFTSAGSGNVGEAVAGAVSELMDDLVINGTGVVGDNPTGTVSVTMGDISSSATGNVGEAVEGLLLITMSDINATGAGNIGGAVTGSVAAQAEGFVIYGEGTFALAVAGTANIQMEDFAIYGRESQEGGIYGAISAMPIEIEEINAIPIEVITK